MVDRLELVRESEYIVVRDNKVVRMGFAFGAEAAKRELRPDAERGEVLYVRLGGQ